jgi:hypothetical protein
MKLSPKPAQKPITLAAATAYAFFSKNLSAL